MSDLQALKDAQFMLGPMYCDYIWQERVKAGRAVPQSKMRLSFKWQLPDNVVPIGKRK